jgi:hypothetical protein
MLRSHTHLQATSADTQTKAYKRVCQPNRTTDRQLDDRKKQRRHNTRLAQWGLTSFIVSFCFYCKFVLADNLVFQNPPLRKAADR